MAQSGEESSSTAAATSEVPSREDEPMSSSSADAQDLEMDHEATDANQQQQRQENRQEAREWQVQDHPLLRDVTAGMNPTNLLTGLYGPRGERIRHVVHEGSLRLPLDALSILLQQQTPPLSEPAVALPGLDSVVRPSNDPHIAELVVTDVALLTVVATAPPPPAPGISNPLVASGAVEEGAISAVVTYRTVAKNRTVTFPTRTAPPLAAAVVVGAVSGATAAAAEPDRIRGGGGGEEGGKEPEQRGEERATSSGVMSDSGVNVDPAQSTSVVSASSQLPTLPQSTASAPTVASLETPAIASPVPSLAALAPTLAAPAASSQAATTAAAPSISMMFAPPPSTAIPAPAVPASNVRYAAALPAQATVPPEAAPVALAPAPSGLSDQSHGQPQGRAQHATTTTESHASAAQPTTVTMTGTATVAAPVLTPVSSLATATSAAQTPLAAASPMGPVAAIVSSVAPGAVLSTGPEVASGTTAAPAVGEINPPSTSSSGTVAAVVTAAASAQQQQPPPTPTSAKPPSPEPKVISLKYRPNEQWEQHAPGPNDEAPIDPANRTPKPDWYTSLGVSEIEHTALYEWFDGSASHRTPDAYVAAREKVIGMADKLGNRYITATMVRRVVPGDISSLTRLHSFLVTHSLINEDSQNESAPAPACLQDDKSRSRLTAITAAAAPWTDDMKDDLLVAVVDQSRKSSKRARLSGPTAGTASAAPALSIDWKAVSDSVGFGVTARDCEREFSALRLVPSDPAGVAMPAPTTAPSDRPITPDTSVISSGDAMNQHPAVDDSKPGSTAPAGTNASESDLLQEILDGCDPDLACAVTAAALESSGGSLGRAQKTGRVGLVLAQAVEAAQSCQDSVAHLLSEIVDLRMKKLENRLSLLDDIEGMLEAERVALELERRDLYTARCRHWFGGA